VKKSATRRFQERIRQLRLEHGWTQERTAEKCGIGYKLYQLYELGVKQNPGLLTLEKIARGFDLEIQELFLPVKFSGKSRKKT
jgi:transcriptional regulator with XRE-family HTH domain